MKVFTPHGTEEFEGNNFHVDEGYLIVYKAATVDDKTIRLYPVAVFKPQGWLGYAPGEPDEVKPLPIGFRQQASEPSK